MLNFWYCFHLILVHSADISMFTYTNAYNARSFLLLKTSIGEIVIHLRSVYHDKSLTTFNLILIWWIINDFTWFKKKKKKIWNLKIDSHMSSKKATFNHFLEILKRSLILNSHNTKNDKINLQKSFCTITNCIWNKATIET